MDTRGLVVEEPARIVVGVEAPEIVEEVLHVLDRDGRARVVATATDPAQVREAVRQLEPDGLVASPSLIPADLDGTALLGLDTRETVGGLRACLRAGARGFYLWPEEREQLVHATSGLTLPPRDRATDRALTIGVQGVRGGVGVTFLATQLAAAFARLGRDCVLVDAGSDPEDLRVSLGVDEGETVPTLAEVAPAAAELAPERLRGSAWTHPRGFGALFCPDARGARDPRAMHDTISGLAAASDVVLVHMPRGRADDDSVALDRRVLVIGLDVQSFRTARRELAAAAATEVEPPAIVVNRAARGEITPGDVRPTLGVDPAAVIPASRSVAAAQDRGELLPPRHRVARIVERLARALLERGDEAK